jgi:hypothetical protein
VFHGTVQVIKSLEIIASAYEPTSEVKETAKRVILAHDPLATDIVEMLGLNSYPQALSTGGEICG